VIYVACYIDLVVLLYLITFLIQLTVEWIGSFVFFLDSISLLPLVVVIDYQVLLIMSCFLKSLNGLNFVVLAYPG